jgi:peptidyl-tRNA hydrolase
MQPTIYYVVNSALKMSKGKIAAQCCHVNTDIIRMLEHQSKFPRIYREWKKTGETTVVLKANNEEFNAIFEQFRDKKTDSSFREPIMKYQVDEGRTEVEPDTITVLGFTPIYKDNAPECIRNLSTL